MTPDDPLAYVRAHAEGADPGILAETIAAVLTGTPAIIVAAPGVGKTIAVRAAYGLLADVPIEHPRPPYAVDVAQHRDPSPRPPFRAPHHTVSVAGMAGGGTPVRPGELSLADGGMLFLDEWPEFSSLVRGAIVHALFDGEVVIHRSNGGTTRYPVRPRVLAAANPCPCGFLGHPDRACVDPPSAIERYRARLDTFERAVPGAIRIEPTPLELVAPYRARLLGLLATVTLGDIRANPAAFADKLRRCDPRRDEPATVARREQSEREGRRRGWTPGDEGVDDGA